MGSLGRGIGAGAATGTASRGRTAGESPTVELREEELRVQKEQVEAGEVRLRKEVVSEDRTIEVPVTREEVVIERKPATGGGKTGGKIDEGEEVRIPLMEEEVRVDKTPVVREEVSLKKRQVQDTEHVSETVRREEARIEETGAGRSRSKNAEAWRGNERRYRHDTSYTGPERRTAGV